MLRVWERRVHEPTYGFRSLLALVLLAADGEWLRRQDGRCCIPNERLPGRPAKTSAQQDIDGCVALMRGPMAPETRIGGRAHGGLCGGGLRHRCSRSVPLSGRCEDDPADDAAAAGAAGGAAWPAHSSAGSVPLAPPGLRSTRATWASVSAAAAIRSSAGSRRRPRAQQHLHHVVVALAQESLPSRAR